MGEERVDVHVAEGRLAGVALAEVGTAGAEQHVHVAVRRIEAVRAGYGAVVLARDESDVAEHHDVADVFVRTEVQILWHLSLAVRSEVRHGVECLQNLALAALLGEHHCGEARREALVPRLVEHLVETYDALVGETRHAVVGSHDEVDVGSVGHALYVVPELAEQTVERLHLLACLRTLRSEGVSAVVGLVEVSHDELRTLVGRHLQHLLNLRHALHIRQQRLLGIAVPVVGIFALDSHVGARPVDHAHALALTFCGEPYRNRYINRFLSYS